MIGFYQGILQQSLHVDFLLSIPVNPDFERIDSVIDLILSNGGALLENLDNGASSNEHVPARYAGRILQLAAGLQLLGQVPIFSAGKIVEMRSDSENEQDYHVKAYVPYLDLFPQNFLRSALTTASSLVSWSNEKQADVAELNSLYELIQQKIIKPLQRFADSGVSTVPILRAAYDQKIPFWHLGNGTYLLGMGARGHLISRSATDIDSALGAQISTKKHLTAQLLKIAGIPVPPHFLVSTLGQAKKAAKALGWPVVVKPTDRERSEGVTTGLKEEAAVAAAFSVAQRFSKNILVERQIPGVCYRLMIANKKFLYAVERRPRSVIGNGADSIRELLTTEQAINAQLPPWLRKKSLILDKEFISAIDAQGFNLESVPEAGVRVSLRAVESTEWGETTFDVTADVAIENIELAERAASVLGLNNAGIDMISADISKPWFEVGAAINEINFRPHFGGTSAAKARMHQYVNELVTEKGRVPVEVYVGDEQAFKLARARQISLVNRGVRSYLTTHQITYGLEDKPRQFAGTNSLLMRCRALLVDKDVDSILLVVQTDELLQAGAPVHRISKLNIVNHELSVVSDSALRATAADVEQTIALLRSLEVYPA